MISKRNGDLSLPPTTSESGSDEVMKKKMGSRFLAALAKPFQRVKAALLKRCAMSRVGTSTSAEPAEPSAKAGGENPQPGFSKPVKFAWCCGLSTSTYTKKERSGDDEVVDKSNEATSTSADAFNEAGENYPGSSTDLISAGSSSFGTSTHFEERRNEGNAVIAVKTFSKKSPF